MDIKTKVLEAMEELDKPVSINEVADHKNIDKKLVEKAIMELKKEEVITSPIRCKWEIKKD